MSYLATSVFILLVIAAGVKGLRDHHRDQLRRQTGWKPWRVYGSSAGRKCGAFDFDKGKRGRLDFDNEDAAVRYAYRRSIKNGPTARPIAVYRGDQLVVRWHQGEVWNEDDGQVPLFT